VLQWLQILWYVPRRKRSRDQQKMMRKARRYHLTRLGLVLLVLVGLAYSGSAFRNRLKAESLRDRILDAKTTDVPAIVAECEDYRPWLDPLLRQSLAEADARGDARRKRNCSLAL